MTQCRCGNTARHGTTMCGRCEAAQNQADAREDLRQELGEMAHDCRHELAGFEDAPVTGYRYNQLCEKVARLAEIVEGML